VDNKNDDAEVVGKKTIIKGTDKDCESTLDHPALVFLKSAKCKELITSGLDKIEAFFQEYKEGPNDLFILDTIVELVKDANLSVLELASLAINFDRVVAEANHNLNLQMAKSDLDKAGFVDKSGFPISKEKEVETII